MIPRYKAAMLLNEVCPQSLLYVLDKLKDFANEKHNKSVYVEVVKIFRKTTSSVCDPIKKIETVLVTRCCDPHNVKVKIHIKSSGKVEERNRLYLQ